MTPTPPAPIPSPAQRAALNRQLHATGHDTGFWDDHGRPAPWPEDIEEWRPSTAADPITDPDQQPF
jgi:hypothetical protein